MIDQARKSQLLERIKSIGLSPNTETVVSVAQYFDGYDEAHCIICANRGTSISTRDFRKHLELIQDRNDVSGVHIRVYDILDAIESEDCWINSDTVFVATGADIDSVRSWFADLEPDSVTEIAEIEDFVNLPNLPTGHRLVAVWWD